MQDMEHLSCYYFHTKNDINYLDINKIKNDIILPLQHHNILVKMDEEIVMK